MKNNQVKGISYILFSAVFFASYGIWSKLMIGVFGEFNQAWVRAAILLLILNYYGLTPDRIL